MFNLEFKDGIDFNLDRLALCCLEGKICLNEMENGDIILSEIWTDGESSKIYPFAKLLTDKQKKKLVKLL